MVSKQIRSDLVVAVPLPTTNRRDLFLVISASPYRGDDPFVGSHLDSRLFDPWDGEEGDSEKLVAEIEDLICRNLAA